MQMHFTEIHLGQIFFTATFKSPSLPLEIFTTLHDIGPMKSTRRVHTNKDLRVLRQGCQQRQVLHRQTVHTQ